jgi:hypothetical protein
MTSTLLQLGVLSALAVQPLHAVKFDDCYKVETIKLPAGVPPEVGAIDFAEDGTLFIVLRRGDVLRAKPTADPAATKAPLATQAPAAPTAAPAATPPSISRPATQDAPRIPMVRAVAGDFLIPTPADVGAALLQRAGVWLLVLDANLPLDPGPLGLGTFAATEILRGPQATVFRIPATALGEPRLTRRADGWLGQAWSRRIAWRGMPCLALARVDSACSGVVEIARLRGIAICLGIDLAIDLDVDLVIFIDIVLDIRLRFGIDRSMPCNLVDLRRVH